MDFLALQKDLQIIIGDTRTEWLPDQTGVSGNGTSLKAAVNHGVKQVFDRLKQNSLFKTKNEVKASIVLTAGVGTLPSDYGVDFEIWLSGGETYYNYRISDTENKIFLEDAMDTTIDFWYIKNIVPLSLTTDTPLVPSHFHEVIALFAMEKYHQAQMDWDNISRSVAYAEEKLEDLITKYY